jgi:alpha-glucosidase (family GH31 glycosyl hydrolase)
MAYLLQSEYQHTSEYHQWRLLFPYIYGKSITAMARGLPEIVAIMVIFTKDEKGPIDHKALKDYEEL